MVTKLVSPAPFVDLVNDFNLWARSATAAVALNEEVR
jgi:hypothetical protein